MPARRLAALLFVFAAAADAQATPPETSPSPAARPQVPAGREAVAEPLWQALRSSPSDRKACLAALREIGAVFETTGPLVGDRRDCGVPNPVAVAEILPGVALEPAGTMRCEAALALARWTRDWVVPAAERTGALPALRGIDQGSTFVCRTVGRVEGGTFSQHAFGNAVDVMGFTFADGSRVSVAPRAGDGDLKEAFQRTVRAAACLEFTTVLGPGYDAAHVDHLHLDLAQRSSGYRLCE